MSDKTAQPMKTELDWITTTLINDEASSDEEMTDHFAKEGNMSRKEAEYYVSQRNEALRKPLTFRLRAYESALPEEYEIVSPASCLRFP